MQRIKKIALRILLLFIALIGLAVGLAYLFEDEVKLYAVNSVNKYVKTEIKVEQLDFSFIKRFPSASLEFKNVLAYGASESTKKDTLFFMKSIFMEFDIWKLINKKYVLKQLSFEEGKVNLTIDKYGEENYIFWKVDSTDKSASEINISLNAVILKGIDFKYLNQAKNILFSNHFYDLNLKGEFTAEQFDLTFESDTYLKLYRQNTTVFGQNQSMKLSAVLSVDTKKEAYTFKNARLNYSGLQFLVDGEFKNSTNSMFTDIRITSESIEMPQLINLLTEEQQNALESYQIDGNISMNGLIKGNINDLESPSLKFNFSVNDASFIHQASNIALNQISLDGNYTNGAENSLRTSSLSINDLNAQFGKGNIGGALKISDFNDPYFQFNGHLKLYLDELIAFMEYKEIENAEGEVNVQIKTEGRVANLNQLSLDDWKKAKTEGEIVLLGVNFKVNGKPQIYKNISGTLEIKNNDIRAYNLNGNISRSDFYINGLFQNLIAYLFSENEQLYVDASLRSKRIFLDELLLTDDQSSSDSTYRLNFSPLLSVYLDSKIDSLSFRKFSFSKSKAFFSLQDEVLRATNVSFNTMKGRAEGNLLVNAKAKDKVIISTNARFNEISITDLFNDFGNFGQQTLTAENLKGIANCELQIYTEWDKSLNLNPKSIEAQADLQIDKGELINFSPLESLSNYISLSELKHIKFATLSNQIVIKNERIFIPAFDINSSALNLRLEGSHTFKNEINYHIRLLLDDILGNKVKKARRQQSEFGRIEDDGLGKTQLFIKMTGTVDNPIISYDLDALKTYWKEEFKEEKKVLKSLLKEEFGLFKKDTTLNSIPKKPSNKSPFDMEWEEEKKTKSEEENKQIEAEKEKKNEKKSGFGKFMDKIAEPNKDEFE